MVRGKVQIRRIENAANRQATFCKRRNGLLKKAHELSILCDAEVAVIIFSQNGKLFEFASTDQMEKIIDRYNENANQMHNGRIDMEQYKEQLVHESPSMAKKTEILEISLRKLMGQDLDSCSPGELQDIGRLLEIGLRNIKARKAQLFKEHIAHLQGKERLLLEENARLSKQRDAQPWLQSNQPNQGVTYLSLCSKRPDGETELFTGLPQMRCL